MEFVADLVGSLAWPISVFTIAWLLRYQLQQLLPSLRSVRWREWRLEFGRTVAEVDEDVGEVERAAAREGRPIAPTEPGAFSTAEVLLDVSPRAAVMEAWRIFESQVKRLADRMGLDLAPGTSFEQLLHELWIRGIILAELKASADTLRGLRNQAVHADDAVISRYIAAEYIETIVRLTANYQSMLTPQKASE
jgi:Domain of unknown function (DUF4145)